MESKQEILIMLREEFDRWEALLSGLTEAQITARNLPSDLSIKDVIGHLRAWQQISIARMEAALNHHEPQYPGDWPPDPDAHDQLQRINAWIHDTYKDQPWSSVHQQWRDGFQRFIELGEAIPESDLMTVGRYPWLADYPLSAILLSSYRHHHEEHFEPLTACLREHGIIKEAR